MNWKFLLFLSFTLLFACGEEEEIFIDEIPEVIRDWQEIKADSVINILAENSPASFFIYKGRNMGYEYELLYEFAKDQNIRLQVTMVNDLDEMFMLLDSCVGDVIACNLSITEERTQMIDYTKAHLKTHQVLIQRKPKNYRKLNKEQLEDTLISEIEELSGAKIHVWKNSSYYRHLVTLNDQLDLDLTIIATDGDLITEELIRMVSEGEIDYTIADENIAKIDASYYPNIDISLKMSNEDSIAFGIRKNAPILKAKLDDWLTSKENISTIGEVKRKYFERKNIINKANKDFSSLNGAELSPYDEIIKAESEKIGWDWRLISAIIYQESKFEVWKESWAGAFGIFQFMPSTAAGYGISRNSSAEAQIKAGIKKLNKNYQQWLELVSDSTECINFTLATFNAGRAHVDDARSLCAEYDLNPDIWHENTAEMIRNLSKPTYYRNKAVKHGYCRGIETYKYVIEITQRFEEYKAAFPTSE